MSAQSNTNWGQVAIAGAIVIGIGTLVGAYKKDKPGGDVEPGASDDRPATIDEVDAEVIAEALRFAFWGTGIFQRPWEYDVEAGLDLMLAQVTDDVQLIMNAFGTHGPPLAQLTLAETVAKFLDADVKAEVNADYEAKGITIRWG